MFGDPSALGNLRSVNHNVAFLVGVSSEKLMRYVKQLHFLLFVTLGDNKKKLSIFL
jgi:hypothetical protein